MQTETQPTTTTSGERIHRAMIRAGASQRTLAGKTGISQATLSRIINNARVAKVNELISLAWALGVTLADLTGSSPVRERVQCAARATDGSTMELLHDELLYFLELDAALADQAIT